MQIEVQYRGGAIKIERYGDIKDLSIISNLGYREAFGWATESENADIVLSGLLARDESEVKNYIDPGLLDRYCRNVWGQGVPNNADFCFGFYVGLDDAVKRLSGQKNH